MSRGGQADEACMLWHELISYVSDLSLLNAAAVLDEQRVDDGLEQAG